MRKILNETGMRKILATYFLKKYYNHFEFGGGGGNHIVLYMPYVAMVDSIAEFYSKVAKTTIKPILIYNFPARCEQHAISSQLAAIIAQNNLNIIGVKDSSADARLTKDIIRNHLPLQTILGNDRFLVETLELMQKHKCSYQTASISGASSVPQIAKIEAEIYNLFSDNNYSQAHLLQHDLIDQYFNSWATQAARLGGEAPIIKSLISADLQCYPTMVRYPLKELENC